MAIIIKLLANLNFKTGSKIEVYISNFEYNHLISHVITLVPTRLVIVRLKHLSDY